MADDQLRMQAVITDGYTGPLAKLRNELRAIGGNASGRRMEKDWKAVEKSIGGVVGSLKTGLAPVLSGIGVASLGVGTAITGAILGLRGFANSTREMRLFSNEIGISTQRLREIKVLGEFFGLSWETAQSSLKTFSGNLDEMQRHWGQAYNQLRGMNLGGLAEELASAPNMAAALDRAMEGIRKIQNPVRRRQVAELLLGSDQWAVIAAEASPKVQKQIHEMLKALPQGSKEAADQFAVDMLKIQLHLENLKTQGFAPLLPEVDRLIKLLTTGGAAAGDGSLVRFAKSLAAELKNLNDVIEKLEKGEYLGALKGLFAGVPIRDGLKLKREKLAGAEAALGLTEKEIAASKRSGYSTGLLELQRKQLVDEIEKLRKALEDANRNGALLQQQSFSRAGFGGARIMNASLGGGGASAYARPPAARMPWGAPYPMTSAPACADRNIFARAAQA